jgi:Ca2+-binding EF-hand superfamily protein
VTSAPDLRPGDELAAALKAAEPDTMTEEHIDRVMKQLDTDASGSISAAEFRAREEGKLQAMKALYRDMVDTFEQYDVCRALFFYLLFTMICE